VYKKLCQYYIFKTTSSRLKNSKYDINITLNQARENGEIVSVGDSQVIRSLLKLKNKETDFEKLNSLFLERKQVRKKSPTYKTYQRLIYLENEIDDMLFIPELVSVIIEHNSHYKQMIKSGFFINNKKYTRLLCGAGQSRRNTVIFISVEYEEELKRVLNNDRNPKTEISPAKFNAYFALASSATYKVSEPYFCVIPDCEITRTEKVEFVEEHDDSDDTVSEKEMELPFNLFDGQGLISPRLAKTWAEELGLDYIPSAFIVRNSFLKGMICVIDFHEYSEEIGEHIIKDVWGNNVNIRDMDIIFTESQFKLWSSYESCSAYVDACRRNGFYFGISRYTPKEDTRYTFTNYQFLQVLNLSDEQIKSLCNKTIEYFDKIINSDINYTIMYLMGKISNKGYDSEVFDKIGDNITKSLMLNHELIKDPYIRNHLINSLNKRIRDSYIGNLIVDGNYQIMISDPYALMEWVFKRPVHGLLHRGEHYSSYWNKRNEIIIGALRAPLTWRSEVNKLSLIKNDETEHWYKYLTSGIIYNVHGVDCMIHADRLT
jgi:hypothetical protein